METKNSKISRLLVLRRFSQLLIVFLLFLTPILGFARLDKKNDSIWLFHNEIFLNSVSVYEVTLFISFLIILGFLIYLLFGRIWCGFFCPQLTVYEFRDFVIKKIKKVFGRGKKPVFAEKMLTNSFIAVLALGLTYSLSSYFISFDSLKSFNPENLVYPLLVVFPLFIADLTVLRPKMCDYCMYGYTQSSLSDENSIGISYSPSGTKCKTCTDCKDVCPQGFDPRNTNFRTCFNCAKCVDACKEGFISFGFSGKNKKGFSVLNFKTAFIATVLIAIAFLMYLAPFRAGKIRFTAANYNLYHYWNYELAGFSGYYVNKFVINATNFTGKSIAVKPLFNDQNLFEYQFLKNGKRFTTLNPHGKKRFIFYVGVRKGVLPPGVHDYKISLVSPKTGTPFETDKVSIYIPHETI